ncbi:ferredoxin reductase [Pseudonocardia sp. T1-2H]|jgi:ferredoxin-NADP reductase|uniref:ferredoxin reductase n=1 Tax=Pseudonocardia sp. T1-2H TaxID=3128899 RepID=UPI003100D736
MSAVGRFGRSLGSRVGRRARSAAHLLTTPLLPDDVLGTLNPMWSRRDPRARVVRVRRETADTTTLFLRPGAPFATHRPGQFIGIGLRLDGVWHWRTYSVTSRPGDELLAVTVTAVPGGRMSGLLAHGTPAGSVVALGPAAGEFVLPEPTPEKLLFVTAGSGITPVMGMLRALPRNALSGAVLVHCDRTPADVVFGPELRELASTSGLRLVERHTALHGRLTPAALADEVPDWAARETWACGPGGLLDDLGEFWSREADPDTLHVERFRPPALRGTEGTGGRITFAASGITADAAPETPVLVAGEDAGALLPNGCRMGICHTCVGKLRAGAVRDLHTGELIDAAETPDRPVRTCVTAPTGDITLDL